MSRIIVKNLPKNVTEDKLRSIFGVKGQITDVQLKYTKDGVFREFAFIGFHDEASAEEAIQYFDKSSINTKRISVQNCASLGDGTKPKSWSKYAKDSSAFQNSHKSDENAEKTDKKQKKAKKLEAAKELLNKYKDDPLFDEFLQVHSSKKAQELLQQVKTSKLTETIEDIDTKQDHTDATDAKSAQNEITDEDYLTLLKKKTPRQKMQKKPKVKIELFNLKIRNLPYNFKKKDLKDFFRPLPLYSVRIPRNIKGIAFVGFKDETKYKKALLKNKSIMKGNQIGVSDYTKNETNVSKTCEKQKWKDQEKALNENEEGIAESGRIFLRNLSYTTSEDDVRTMFEKHGPIAEVNLPIDFTTRRNKGFGFVTFVMPEDAVKAYTQLDGKILHGRLLHLLPSKPSKEDTEKSADNSTDFKVKQAKKQSAQANQSHNWNALFLGHHAVAGVIANTYNTSKEKVLNDEDGGAAVRLALGETLIVANTRKYLEENGVILDAFANLEAKRSKTIILVKNLPAETDDQEIVKLFKKYGVIIRFIFPPCGITAIVEFAEPAEARKAFKSLAYTEFHGMPLYLEWAPENSIKKDAKKTVIESKMEEIKEVIDENDGEDEEPEENTTLFVKNLHISTTDQDLRAHFADCGKISYANVATKIDPNHPSNKLSLGYGFVRFMCKISADKALKSLQFSSLCGKNIELKRSERTIPNDLTSKRKVSVRSKQNGTKILVKNIPFQAKRKEVLDLFKTFGEIKALRLPKKMGDENCHRGFGFVDFSINSDAKNAFEALSQSTHLYGRRLVLEWAENLENVDDIRKRTADHFLEPHASKRLKKVLLNSKICN